MRTHLLALLLLAPCIFLTGCEGATSPGDSTASAAGRWSMELTNPYFAALAFSLEFRDTLGMNAAGSTAAFLNDRLFDTCRRNPLACGVTGIVVDATQVGSNVTVSLSFGQTPLGVTISGRVLQDGTLRGQLFVRDGTPTPPPPVSIMFRRQ